MQIIDISLSSQSTTPIFNAVQYDSARECGFFVEEDISDFDTVTAKFTVSTGRVAPVTCTIDDHLVSFILPLNLTRQFGLFNAVIQFFNADSDTAVHTFPFKVDVRENPSKDGDTYERAYQDMVTQNTRAEQNNTQMESYISAYGSITPEQLTTLLSDLQNIKNAFDGQSMTSIGNRLTAMESSISAMQTNVSTNTTDIATLRSILNDYAELVNQAVDDIEALQTLTAQLNTLADSAVYHD